MEIEFDLIGDESVIAHYDGIADRARDPEPAFEHLLGALEDSERERFDRQPIIHAPGERSARRRYDRTGRLRRSLTQPDATDAIRRAHGDELDFGTTVPYAKYQRKDGQSAVLGLDPAIKLITPSVLMDHLMGRPL